MLIEDDAGRTEVFRQWLEVSEFVLVVARSGGQALGMLAKGSTDAIAGLLLDHDLSDSPITEMDHRLSTSDLIPLIKRRLRRTVPILIHSHNANKPVVMERSLKADGFSVTRIRFNALKRSRFEEWLQDVRDCYKDFD